MHTQNKFGQDQFGTWIDITINSVIQRFRLIGSGTFLMGSPETEEGRFRGEGPQHEVTISQPFWMADTPCTQSLWEAVMGENPSHFKGPNRPVENVNWIDVQVFLQRLNEILPTTGSLFRLPTEAEWEYACRAGNQGPTYGDLDDIAWYLKNSGGETHPVAQKKPNAWGLYDMLGNVDEWCHDGMRYYSPEAVTDPMGFLKDDDYPRVIRSGSCEDGARYVRAAFRDGDHPDNRYDILGFRIIRGGS